MNWKKKKKKKKKASLIRGEGLLYIYLESLIDPFNSEVIEEIDFSMKVKEFWHDAIFQFWRRNINSKGGEKLVSSENVIFWSFTVAWIFDFSWKLSRRGWRKKAIISGEIKSLVQFVSCSSPRIFYSAVPLIVLGKSNVTYCFNERYQFRDETRIGGKKRGGRELIKLKI